ncbi:YicC/YloC family endoribonuclease [Thioflexithrix psekupsensis]|uniref:YicC family protein n=1 Tax=Thioflexithrix psekupsensis TaxID=1570016 RepID=A0A251XAA2_9GAMM|nr:YicC/YloC family endoribonuclease [Thioflexithrix psekupsensis]OUD14657.1 YicC family protein [Thioflexithrix psekupsensis]
MTAFARNEQHHTWGQLCWEIRSVNHRYLDISIRLPEEFRRLEVDVQTQVQRQLKRGKIYCNLYLQYSGDANQLTVNQTLVKNLLQAHAHIETLANVTQTPQLLDILRWPNVLENHIDTEQIAIDVMQSLQVTLDALSAHRQREGQQLIQFVEQRCVQITQEIAQIRNLLPEMVQQQREKWQLRLAEITALNPERLEQEMLILAQKSDVSEELDRLTAHIQEIRQTLKTQDAIGRRLDFLAQELHREANTLGAKSGHLTLTKSAIELKVHIEQIREQIQNLE